MKWIYFICIKYGKKTKEIRFFYWRITLHYFLPFFYCFLPFRSLLPICSFADFFVFIYFRFFLHSLWAVLFLLHGCVRMSCECECSLLCVTSISFVVFLPLNHVIFVLNAVLFFPSKVCKIKFFIQFECWISPLRSERTTTMMTMKKSSIKHIKKFQ